MSELIPTPDTIPVAWGFFQFLLLLTFPLHIILMNAMLGSAIIALYARFRTGESWTRLSEELAKVLPLIVAFTINFGVAPLLFVQVLYGQFIYTSSILMGVFWLSIILLLIVAYYCTYLFDFKFAALGQAGKWIIGLAVLIFLGIAFLFSNNMTLMLRPEEWSRYFQNSSGTILSLADVTLWPRYLHFIVGGTAVGGLVVALFGKFREKRDPELAELAIGVGMNVFTGLTFIQIAIGFWFLLSLDKPVMTMFMGDNMLATILLLAGFMLAIGVLWTAARKKVYLAAVHVVALVYVMTFMRAFVRSGYLQEVYSLDMLKEVPQYSPMIVFFVVLVAGLATVVWLVRKAAEAV
ncbi:MAG: hypothetical protein JXQ27_00150 [Acidobacteria bacterium]|nr:hypothetical protein [Acidobacteriota bacterium]